MNKKNIVKALIIIGVIILIGMMIHLVGGNFTDAIKNHLGM